MATVIKCENCGKNVGSLQEAFVWLDHPVCPDCYQTLKSSRGGQLAVRTWKLLTICGFASAACILAILLFVWLNRPNQGNSTASNAAYPSATPADGGAPVTVQSAFYGQNVSWIDVTEKVRGMVGHQSKWSIAVNSAAFGDPAPGWDGKRSLIIQYTHAGKLNFKATYEGEMISLP